jgi:hypothetical protein
MKQENHYLKLKINKGYKMKSFKEFLTESGFGAMGGDQRNNRGSTRPSKDPDYDGEWNGKSVHVDSPRWKSTNSKNSASEYNLKLLPSDMTDKTVEISGKPKDIISYLVSQGWNEKDVKKSYKL